MVVVVPVRAGEVVVAPDPPRAVVVVVALVVGATTGRVVVVLTAGPVVVVEEGLVAAGAVVVVVGVVVDVVVVVVVVVVGNLIAPGMRKSPLGVCTTCPVAAGVLSGGLKYSSVANPTKATAINNVDRRIGKRRCTGTDMNPTNGLWVSWSADEPAWSGWSPIRMPGWSRRSTARSLPPTGVQWRRGV